MELIPSNTNIDFVGKMKFCGILSAVLIGVSILGWVVLGFNLGIDFRGGTQLQITVPEGASGVVDESRMRDAFARAGYGDAEVTRFGDAAAREFLVRLATSEAETTTSAGGASASAPAAAAGTAHAAENGAPASTASTSEESEDSSGAPVDDADGPDEETPAKAGEAGEVKTAAATQPGAAPDAAAEGSSEEPAVDPSDPAAGLVGAVQRSLTEEFGIPVKFESIESIGPRVGQETTMSAIYSVLLTSVLILLYIWVRFDLRYAPGAVVALFHDVLVVGGVFAWFRIPFDQQIVAAMLVILGYSINDTVVIYDRVRENVALRGKALIREVVNDSLNQTLSRTLLTTSFTLIVVLSLLIFGGPVLRGLSLALLVGMISGVYSTVYVATAMLIWLEERHQRATARSAA
jgi:preprotein translocase subunit SecF